MHPAEHQLAVGMPVDEFQRDTRWGQQPDAQQNNEHPPDNWAGVLMNTLHSIPFTDKLAPSVRVALRTPIPFNRYFPAQVHCTHIASPPSDFCPTLCQTELNARCRKKNMDY